jgi:hypothetical protein
MMRISGSVAADGIFSVTNTNTAGYSDIVFQKNDFSIQGAIGYGNSTVGLAHLSTKNFLYSVAGVNWVVADATATRFVFDMTNFRLGIGTATPAWALHVKGTVSAEAIARFEHTSTGGYVGLEFVDSAAAYQVGIGYGNSAVGVTYLQSKIYVYSAAAKNIIFANATKTEIEYGMTDGSIFIEMQNGSSAAVSAANAGRVIYTTTGQKYRISANGAAYLDVALLGATLTTGSVPFADSSGHLAQDNANLFWDDTNNRLGLGTNSSLIRTLTVFDGVSGGGPVLIRSTVADGYSSISCFDSANVEKSSFGYGNASVGAAHFQSKNYLYSAGPDWVIGDATATRFAFDMTNFRLGIGTATPAIALDLATGTAEAGIQFRIGTTLPVSAASTGRIRYNATSQLFQISKNTAAYEDMASLATAQTFTKSQNVSAVALTDAANISTDASLGNTFTVTLGGNRTLDNPTNLVAGGVYRWAVTQDGTGSRTLAYGTLFKWSGGTAPTLTTTAAAIDSITAIYDGSVLLASYTLNYA